MIFSGNENWLASLARAEDSALPLRDDTVAVEWTGLAQPPLPPTAAQPSQPA
ncbi:hypothetical protein HA052_00985 [Chromobacterium haemolyticum]|uniref:Uncharacterized protein n=1 Tax=Chromobacterium fluminis TaxID=3044269 RepID=A0ABX0KW59_9NEIS|nr:hypothetical protein [Chromobacterium haemolyticum]NHR03757.1 hypothetical protein [Chromobacterium haemolyticum]